MRCLSTSFSSCTDALQLASVLCIFRIPISSVFILLHSFLLYFYIRHERTLCPCSDSGCVFVSLIEWANLNLWYNYMARWRWLHFKYEAWLYLLPLIYTYNSFCILSRFESAPSPSLLVIAKKSILPVLLFCVIHAFCAASSSLHLRIRIISRGRLRLFLVFHQFHSVISECVQFIFLFIFLHFHFLLIRFLCAGADTLATVEIIMNCWFSCTWCSQVHRNNYTNTM